MGATIAGVSIASLSADGSFKEYETIREDQPGRRRALAALKNMNSLTPKRIAGNDFEGAVDKPLNEISADPRQPGTLPSDTPRAQTCTRPTDSGQNVISHERGLSRRLRPRIVGPHHVAPVICDPMIGVVESHDSIQSTNSESAQMDFVCYYHVDLRDEHSSEKLHTRFQYAHFRVLVHGRNQWWTDHSVREPVAADAVRCSGFHDPVATYFLPAHT